MQRKRLKETLGLSGQFISEMTSLITDEDLVDWKSSEELVQQKYDSLYYHLSSLNRMDSEMLLLLFSFLLFLFLFLFLFVVFVDIIFVIDVLKKK
jgi:ABC-type transporter Mla MlaB component